MVKVLPVRRFNIFFHAAQQEIDITSFHNVFNSRNEEITSNIFCKIYPPNPTPIGFP